MKTTFDLPDEIVREVKLRAVIQGKTVKSLVTEILRDGLGLETAREPPRSDRVVIGPDGIPFIRCRPGAPAERMSAQELLELERRALEEEDLHRAGITL
jgi:hypothetical protein